MSEFRAEVSFVVGQDQNRLVVSDGPVIVASIDWQPTGTLGPADWDFRLWALGYSRTSPWREAAVGFVADCRPTKLATDELQPTA